MQTAAPRTAPRQLAGRAAVALAATSTAFLAVALPTRAAVYTWTGGAAAANGSPDWDAYVSSGAPVRVYTSNWGASTFAPILPTSSASTAITFANQGSGPSNAIIDSPFLLNALTFTADSNPFTLAGKPLAFTAKDTTTLPTLSDASANPQFVSAPLVVNDNLTVSVTGPAALSLTGQITGTTAGVYKTGTGSLVLSGGTATSPTSLPFLHVQPDGGVVYVSGGTLNLTSTGSTASGGESSLSIETGYVSIEAGAHVTASSTPELRDGGYLAVTGAGTSLHVVNGAPGTTADFRIGTVGATASPAMVELSDGASVVDDGDLHVGAPSANPDLSGGYLSVLSGATLTVAGTLTIDGPSHGDLTVGGGSVTVGALASTGATQALIGIANPAGGGVALTVGTAGTDSTFGGAIFDSSLTVGGTLRKVGAGTLTLDTLGGYSFYSGGTVLAGGTLRLASDHSLPVGGALTLSTGTLDLAGHQQTLGTISVTGPDAAISIGDTGTLTLSGDISTADLVRSATPFVISGHALDLGGATRTISDSPAYTDGSRTPAGVVITAPVVGTGGLTLSGFGGSVLLAGSGSSYTGPTTVDNGVLAFLGADGALPSTTALVLNGSAIFALGPYADVTAAGTHIAAGGYDQTVGSVSGSDQAAIFLNNGTLSVGSDNSSTTFGGFILDGWIAGGRLAKVGAGTLTLTRANTYTGGTTLAGGTLAVTADNVLGDAAAPLTFAGGTLQPLAPFSSARSITVSAKSDFNTGGVPSTLTGSFAGSDVLTVVGGGSLTLSGATGTFGALSTFYANPASVTLDHATLSLTTTGSTGINGFSSLFADQGSTITLQNGTHLTTTGYPQIHNTGSVVVDGPSTVWTVADADPANPAQIRVGYFGGTSTLTVRKGATVSTTNMIIGNSSFALGTGAVTVSSGAHLGVAGGLGLFNGSSLAVDRASASVGYVLDESANSTVPRSTITLTDPAAAPGTALVFTPTAPNYTAYFLGAITDGPNGPGGVTYAAPGTQWLYDATYSGPTTVSAGFLGFVTHAPTGAFAANSHGGLGFFYLTLDRGAQPLPANDDSTIVYDGVTLNGGVLRGTGTHYFQPDTNPSFVNAATFLPDTHVTVAAPVTFTNVTSSAAVTVHGSLATTSFENDGALTINNGATLSNSLSNLVSGDGSSVTVNAGGALQLNSTSLALHAATLVNDGTIAGGPTLVYSGSTAKGAGTFGPVSLLSGGTFSPGNSPGPATTGDVTWSSGGAYLFEVAHALGTPGADWDLWNVTGDLTLAASPADPFFLDISPYNLPDFDPVKPYDWPIATVTGSINGFDPTAIVLRPEGVCLCNGTYSLTQTGGDIILHYNPVPEPATLSLLAVGTLSLLTRRRRRRRRRARQG